MEFECSWEKHMALVLKCQIPLCWSEFTERKFIGPAFVQQLAKKVKIIKDCLKISQDRKKSYVDLKTYYIEYKGVYKVFLKEPLWKKIM